MLRDCKRRLVRGCIGGRGEGEEREEEGELWDRRMETYGMKISELKMKQKKGGGEEGTGRT